MMKRTMKATRSILMAVAAGTALLAAGAASAQAYGPRQEQGYDAPRGSVEVSLGWHGDRYWDGRRYWEHDEWMRRHPHDHDPHRDRDRDHEHGDAERY
jgi:hypothetical protein